MAGRLNLPASCQWWGEALHGVCESPAVSFRGATPNGTSFPEIIGVGATFDAPLFAAMGAAVGLEARVMMNAGNAGGTFWAPNINIVKDPRWGRLQETPGECPVLTAAYAALFVGAFQNTSAPATPGSASGAPGSGSYVQASSCCKHFAAYSEENWGGVDRYHFDAQVTAQEWEDTYLPAFQACIVHGRASGLMCSYNAVNGVPACANPRLLTEVARGELGFDGYVTGDCGAAKDVWEAHNFTATAQLAAEAALGAGMDVDCGSFLKAQLLAQNDPPTPVNASALDAALTRLFATRIRLGLFDGAAHDPLGYKALTPASIDRAAHIALARRASDEGIVLLHNTNTHTPPPPSPSFPLSAGALPDGLALVGPNADNAPNMQGQDCHGVPPFLITPRDAFGARLGKPAVAYARGCDVDSADTSGFGAAVAAASNASATVLVLGLDPSVEYEMRDRDTLLLPRTQAALARAVAAAAAARQPAAAPVVVFLFSGGAIDVSELAANPNITAVLWAGYPGQSGGDSIADIALGAVAPSGRAPLTWYKEAYLYNGRGADDPQRQQHALSMWDMGLRPNASSSVTLGRTYRYFRPGSGAAAAADTTLLYPFGHGLQLHAISYGAIAVRLAAGGAGGGVAAAAIDAALRAPDARRHSRLDAPALATAALAVKCAHSASTAAMAARGDAAAAACPHSVLAFLSPPGAGADGLPLKTLAGFARVPHLAAGGAAAQVAFALTAFDLSVVREDGARVAVKGAWTVTVGVEGTDTPVTTTLTVD